MAKKGGLGKGLDTLFLENSIEIQEKPSTIRISAIEPKPDQPRKSFDREALEGLADSISANGVIQPIIVRQAEDGFYQIIAGERRWRAAKMAGLTEIPAVVMEADDFRAAQLAVIENVQRADLNAYEEAVAYQTLIDQYNLTQEDVATRIGKSRSAVTNALRLLDLPEEVLDTVRSGELSAGHARALLGLKEKELIPVLAEKVVQKQLSVRETEALVRRMNRPEPPAKEVDAASVAVNYLAVLEERALSVLGRRIKIADQGKKRRLEIEYSDHEDLEALLRQLCGEAFFDEK